MTITLKDIAESEKICEAATRGPWFKFQDGEGNLEQHGVRGDAWDVYVHSRGDARFIAYARTMLPAMNKLVREMMEMLDELSCDQIGGLLGCSVCVIQIDEHGNPDHQEDCIKGKARRLVERMDGESSP